MWYVTEGYLGTSHRVQLDAAAASFVTRSLPHWPKAFAEFKGVSA